ncbi:lytic transglycosylase domain-containing protein [Methylobacterium ajmalii]|uniref:Lytic transglycosylase domain-containing protein n=1 Tax=Methylobacterium ajmalii TaxID=2738439 RepID=A0ABV0A407_9HYPH
MTKLRNLVTVLTVMAATPALAWDLDGQAQEDIMTMSHHGRVPLPPRRGEAGSVYAIVTQAAVRHRIPPALLHGVIRVESNYNCNAYNRSGATGLGQLMPGTARSLGVRNPRSCHENADGAARYLARFYHKFGGNACAAATAYNRGSGRGCSAYGRQVVRFATR